MSSSRRLVIPPRIKLIISCGELYIYFRVDTAEDLSHTQFTAFIMCHVHDGWRTCTAVTGAVFNRLVWQSRTCTRQVPTNQTLSITWSQPGPARDQLSLVQVAVSSSPLQSGPNWPGGQHSLSSSMHSHSNRSGASCCLWGDPEPPPVTHWPPARFSLPSVFPIKLVINSSCTCGTTTSPPGPRSAPAIYYIQSPFSRTPLPQSPGVVSRWIKRGGKEDLSEHGRQNASCHPLLPQPWKTGIDL